MGYSKPLQHRLNTNEDFKEQDIARTLYHKINNLKNHPNYKDTYPYHNEDIISFTLRTCAHLVSPPQEERESYEVECVDIRDGILALKDEIQERFYKLRDVPETDR